METAPGRPTDGITYPVTGEEVRFLRRARDTDGAFGLIEFTLSPGARGPPEHVHEHRMETYHVFEGTLAGTVDGEPFRIPAGGERTVEHGIPHEWGTSGDGDLRMRGEIRPARRFVEVLKVSCGLVRGGKTGARGCRPCSNRP